MSPEKADIVAIADAAERALGLQMTIRYLDMFHWQQESAAHHAARAAEPDPRLESVADHTWHMTYMVALLLPYFPQLDAQRVYGLAVLHDILELITGDVDPTGADGTGLNAHAMNDAKMADKNAVERAALEQYLAALPAAVQTHHRTLLEEELAGTSDEARFVKVLDKMQVLIYVKAKKNGTADDAALQFLYRYKHKTSPKFPALAPLYDELFDRLVAHSAETRGVTAAEIYQTLQAQAA